jgi:hypothetical protein
LALAEVVGRFQTILGSRVTVVGRFQTILGYTWST